MLHQSHPMLDMTLEGKRLGQIMIYPNGNQTLSPVANIVFMDGSFEANYMHELFVVQFLNRTRHKNL